MTLAEFRQVYPEDAFIVSSGKTFLYRYYKYPEARAPLVLLNGGIGLYGLLFRHVCLVSSDILGCVLYLYYPLTGSGVLYDGVCDVTDRLR